MPDALTFSGYLQPPDVPADPTGEGWRGPQGDQGEQGDPGLSGTLAFMISTLPTSAPAGGGLWNNVGVVCVAPGSAADAVAIGTASQVAVLATGSTRARTLAARAADTINVADFGAKLDGVTNDTAAFQAAYTACPVYGVIEIPAGAHLNITSWPTGTKNVMWRTLGTFDWGTSPAGTNPVFGVGDGDTLSSYFAGRYNFEKTLITSDAGFATVHVGMHNASGNQFPAGHVVSALHIGAQSVPGASGYTWACNLELNSGASGLTNSQDVGYASTVTRYGQSTTWQYYGLTNDITGTATGGIVAGEFDIVCNGPDGATSAYAPATGGRTFFDFNALSGTLPIWQAGHAYTVGNAITAAPAAGFTYVCQTAGTTAGSQPTWPVAAGTVTDGTVVWAFGTTIAAKVSRALAVNTDAQTQIGAALLCGGNYYDAVIEMSGAALIDSTVAGLRLKADMPIDFSGNLTLAGKNVRTLKYNSGSGTLDYTVSGARRLAVDDTGHVGIGTIPAVGILLTVGGSGIVGIDTSVATLSGASLRMASGQYLSMEATDARTISWASSLLSYKVAGSSVLTVSDAGALTAGAGSFTSLAASGTLTASTLRGGATQSFGTTNGEVLRLNDPGVGVLTHLDVSYNSGSTMWTLQPSGVSNLQLQANGGGSLVLNNVSVSSGAINATTIGATTPAAASVTQLNLTTSAGPNIRSGTGAASGTQPKGSLWMRTDGGVGTTMYVSQGAGTWNAVAGV